jgi:hypothetical protein
MHGRFGRSGRIGVHGDLRYGDLGHVDLGDVGLGHDDVGFDCPTHAGLVGVRRIGNGPIDYDFYRARAVTERTRVRRAALTALTRFIRRMTLTIGRKDSPAG